MSGWRAAIAEARRDPTRRRAAVKAVLTELTARAPGRSVELRVPPYGATQVVEGPPHRRGTPKATIELAADTLFDLAQGTTDWAGAVAAGDVLASGERTDLAHLFPLDPNTFPLDPDIGSNS